MASALNWPLLSLEGAPVNGVDEVQSLSATGSPTGGTFTLDLDGEETAAVDFDATSSEVQAALTALCNVEPGDVVCAGGPLPATPVTVRYQLGWGGRDVPLLVVNDALLTAAVGTPHVVVATTVLGVRGSYRGAQFGALLADVVNGVLYSNQGDRVTPRWVEVEA